MSYFDLRIVILSEMSVVNNILSMFLGDKSKRDMKELMPYVEQVKSIYPEIEKLTNDGLRERATLLKQRDRKSVV